MGRGYNRVNDDCILKNKDSLFTKVIPVHTHTDLMQYVSACTPKNSTCNRLFTVANALRSSPFKVTEDSHHTLRIA